MIFLKGAYIFKFVKLPENYIETQPPYAIWDVFTDTKYEINLSKFLLLFYALMG